MDGFGILIGVVTFILALIALNKISRLETRLAQLKLQLGNMGDELAMLRRGETPAADMGPVPETADGTEDRAISLPVEAVPAGQAAMAAETEAAPASSENWQASNEPALLETKPRGDMEQALASRWFVWIGGVAIAIGGLLFVKYAYDNNLIPPALQIVLGLLLGAALVASGELVRRRSDPAGEQGYVPAALSAGGIVTAFGSIYAAYALYELISSTPAFGGLALVALGALALSRLQGPMIAALGLIGSYVTPALIPSEHPSAWGFFPYLLVILAACFATLRGKAWWWLGHAAIAGSAIWTALWIGGPFKTGDIWPVGLFAHLLALISFFGLKGRAILHDESGSLSDPKSLTQPLLIGFAGLAVGVVLLGMLVGRMSHDTPSLILFAAAMALLVLIAWTKYGVSALAPVAGLLMFLGLMAWNGAAFHAMTLDEQGIWSWSNAFGPAATRFLRWMLFSGAAFTLVGVAGLLLRPASRNWGVLGGAAGFLFVWGAWARADFLLSQTIWSLIAAVFAAVMLAGIAAANRRADEPPANFAAGLVAAGSAALLVLALDRLLDRVWLTIAIAALGLAFALSSRLLKPKLIGPISAALASLAALRLFVSRELWMDDRNIAWGQHWVLYGYGLPAILSYAASRVLRKQGHDRSATALEGISLGLAISLIALELRVLIAGSVIYEEPQFLEMAAHILTWLGAAYGLMHRQRIFSSFISLWGARLLIAGSVAAIVLLSLIALNPVVTEAQVPGSMVFNAMLLAYLAPVVLIGLMVRRLDVLGWQVLKPAAGGLALVMTFVYLTLETKRVFQGKLMVAWSLSDAESYAYSAVWLGFALALFIAGLKLGKQYIRYAGLGVMVLVVLKVFLWDMSSLEGLYRIASFIGLGLCLVGIGWLYQRFVQHPRTIEP